MEPFSSMETSNRKFHVTLWLFFLKKSFLKMFLKICYGNFIDFSPEGNVWFLPSAVAETVYGAQWWFEDRPEKDQFNSES